MLFAQIRGLEDTKKRLLHAVQHDNIAHAQLFLGKEGSPNLPMALAYINYVNCENRTDTDACGECPSCAKNAKAVHPDMHFVFPVSSTKKISGKDVVSNSFLTEWRQFLSEQPYGNLNTWSTYYGGEDKQVNISKEESRHIIKNLALKSFEAKYKAMLIWLPEYMHPSAANGILKILEEPPENTLFILVSNNRDRLLTTILSRTQIVSIPNFSDEDIKQYLLAKGNIDEQKATSVANLADGNIAKADRLLNNLEDDNHNIFANWMRDCFRRDFTSLVNAAEEYHRANKLAQRSLLEYGLNIYREALIHQVSPGLKRSNGALDGFIDNFSKVLTLDKTEKITRLMNDAHYHLERNGSAKMIFLDLSLQIARVIK